MAAGERLRLNQDDIKPKGHAIEARIYPEDPDTFLPDAGTIDELHLPEGENIRVDTALFSGYQVALEYEPLLAKVMAWGETREQAAKLLLRALLAFRLEGVKCNIPLMRDILSSKEFTSGTYHTGSIPRWMEERKHRQPNHLTNGAAYTNGHGKSDRGLAAAIGVAIAFAQQRAQAANPALPEPSQWRVYGRREQLLSRTLGKRGWR